MPKKIPMRTCIGCGENKPKSELIRVIRTPSGQVVLDLSGRLNGRGAYLCNDPECLKKARKKKSLQRGLSQEIPEEVLDQLERELGGGAIER